MLGNTAQQLNTRATAADVKPGRANVASAQSRRKLFHAVAGAGLIVAGQSAWAFQFKTDSDWVVRWDNTVKYNVMVRVADQDDEILGRTTASPVADDANLNFDQGSVVSNRVDLVSEFDAVWKDKLGVRITGAGWYDHAYSDDSDYPGQNKALGKELGVPGGVDTWSALSVDPGEYSDETEDYHYRGGELLDAFVFGSFDTDNMSGNVRAGRHTVFWGNSLGVNAAVHGIAGSMVSLDIGKALSVPGVDAQELYMPTARLSSMLQVGNDLTFNAYWSLEYEENRLPQLGAYFSAVEIATDKSEYLVLAPGIPGVRPKSGLVKDDNETPDAEDEWGFNLQYYVAPWNLDAGFVYLNYNDKANHGIVGYLGAPGPITPDALGLGEFKWVYKNDIDLFGLTFNKEVAGVSMGLDLVYRQDTPLPSELRPSVTQSADVFAAADSDNYTGPVGDTAHIILNGLYVLPPTKLWQGGSLGMELTASWLDSVSENEELLNVNVREDRVATTGLVLFSPQWFQVLRSTDLTMPMSVGYTFNNHAPIAQGGDEGLGSASIGLDFLYNQVWNFTAKYNVYFGSVDNGSAGLLKDRDNVAFTVKRTF